MNKSAILYFIAGALALLAAVGYVVRGGFLEDEYLRVILLVGAGATMLWLGLRERRKPAG